MPLASKRWAIVGELPVWRAMARAAAPAVEQSVAADVPKSGAATAS
jgi:hypothetical protein